VIATTLAVIAIFLPVAFMDGIIGKFFLQFAVAVSIAVALSSLEALTLTPMRCSILLNSGPRRTKIGRGIDFSIITVTAFYKRALEFLLNHRLKLIFATMALFFASLFILNELQREFAPEQDEGRIFIRMQTPEGSSLAYTDRKAKEVESWLMEQPYMDRYFVAVGGFGGGQVTSANIFVTLKEKRDLNQQEIAQLMREKFRQLEGVRAFVQGSSSSIIGGRRGFPVELSVRGPNWDQIILEAEMLSKKMEESGKFTDVNMDNVQGSPEILILPDRVRAQTLGVEISDISQTIRVLFGGVNAALYSQGGQRMDVRVQLRPEDRERMEDLSGVQVRNNRGELVALTELVQIRESSGPPTISREQRVRSVGIGANPAEGVSQEESLVFIQALARESLSEGYYIALTGSSEAFSDSFRSLIFALILGIIVAYMVLASQFNSFIDPLVVLAALPFAFSGAFIALFWTGQTLNIYSMIGLILLVGLAMKNSIMLVEFTNQVREKGFAVKEALLEACPLRFRPILMTSCATIAAATPPALALGPGAETRIPMAIVVIGGIAVSTAMTLFVVPCLYSLIARKRRTQAEWEEEIRDSVEAKKPEEKILVAQSLKL
jgi:multidrug efflux pump subunit AcrB